jgi:hypothetical protein
MRACTWPAQSVTEAVACACGWRCPNDRPQAHDSFLKAARAQDRQAGAQD